MWLGVLYGSPSSQPRWGVCRRRRNDMRLVPARPVRRALKLLALVPVLAGLAACGDSTAAGDTGSGGAPDELRLGYFANVAHAAALIGVQEGYIQEELGDTKLATQVFNAGPDEVEALRRRPRRRLHRAEPDHQR